VHPGSRILASRTRRSAKQTPDNAPVANCAVTEITVTDPAHPFFGQRLAVAYRRGAVPGDHVLVQLASGARRAIPVAATSLATHIRELGDRAAPSLAPISVRTLVPVVHLVRALKRRAMEVPDAAADNPASTDPLSRPIQESPAGCLAQSGAGTPGTRRPRPGSACSTAAPAAPNGGGSR
jgi:Family of unknown function (DUF5372)